MLPLIEKVNGSLVLQTKQSYEAALFSFTRNHHSWQISREESSNNFKETSVDAQQSGENYYSQKENIQGRLPVFTRVTIPVNVRPCNAQGSYKNPKRP